MAGITLAVAQKQLESWIKADEKVSNGQSYSHEGRQLTRADAAVITEKIDYWSEKVNQLSGRGRRGIRRVNIS